MLSHDHLYFISVMDNYVNNLSLTHTNGLFGKS